jgi:hypothetical protein
MRVLLLVALLPVVALGSDEYVRYEELPDCSREIVTKEEWNTLQDERTLAERRDERVPRWVERCSDPKITDPKLFEQAEVEIKVRFEDYLVSEEKRFDPDGNPYPDQLPTVEEIIMEWRDKHVFEVTKIKGTRLELRCDQATLQTIIADDRVRRIRNLKRTDGKDQFVDVRGPMMTATRSTFQCSTTPIDPPSNYEFTLLADNRGVVKRFEKGMALNDSGEVAFIADLREDKDAVVMVAPGVMVTIADDTGNIRRFKDVAINNSGGIAFIARIERDPFDTTSPNAGIFLSQGGTDPVLIVDNTAPIGEFRALFLNDAGEVTFHASLERGLEGIVRSDGVITTRLLDNDGWLGGFSLAAISKSGGIAFMGPNGTGGYGLYLWVNGRQTQILDFDGPLKNLRSPAINSSNVVSYYGETDTKGRAIYINNGGRQTTLAERNGVYYRVGNHTEINDNGLVAFDAWTHDGICGLFVSDGTVTNRVVSYGDRLDGRAFKQIQHQFRLNNQGAIAFIVKFEDETKALYLATPKK